MDHMYDKYQWQVCKDIGYRVLDSQEVTWFDALTFKKYVDIL